MAAICNGIVAHKGFRVYCSTFFSFSDYMRPSIRLAALMKLPVIYIFTHDSIYVGEDGPTHQPVEQLESLRVVPGLRIFRPADDEEVKWAWEEVLKEQQRPVALVLSRQNLPHLLKDQGMNEFQKGGYIVVKEEKEKPDVVLIASGSEVSLALETSTLLKEKNIVSRVVSVPDRGTLFSQDEAYIENLLGGKDALRVVMEVNNGQGWYRILKDKYLTVLMESFGKSAPGKIVADDFGFSAEKITQKIIKAL
jgi:transketolase